MKNSLHPNLPPLPKNMRHLPIDARGFPVPFFVEWFHADGKAFEHIGAPPQEGDYPDFRVMSRRKMAMCVRFRRCWVCGGQLGVHVAFTVGPMCIVNRTSGEPPSHRECAIFSATACPFLSKPAVERRENNLPPAETITIHPAMLDRNPGCTAVWITRDFRLRQTADGVLFTMGDPEEILYFAQGRKATREEIMHSITTGMPFLRELAELQGEEAIKSLDESYAEALTLVPAA